MFLKKQANDSLDFGHSAFQRCTIDFYSNHYTVPDK